MKNVFRGGKLSFGGGSLLRGIFPGEEISKFFGQWGWGEAGVLPPSPCRENQEMWLQYHDNKTFLGHLCLDPQISCQKYPK